MVQSEIFHTLSNKDKKRSNLNFNIHWKFYLIIHEFPFFLLKGVRRKSEKVGEILLFEE